MSSTNRGAVRCAADFYPTPLDAFEPLLPFLPAGDVEFWEPACGDGRLINSLRDSGRKADGADLSQGVDFLKDTTPRRFIITNPPFSLAFEFCQHANRHSQEVCMLLRLNFLGSQKRKAWFRAFEPSALFVLSKRPDFTGAGGDSCDYAWFYWGPFRAGIHHL